MGGLFSKPAFVQQEELTWARDHDLAVSEEFRSRYRPLMDQFPEGSEARMCFSVRTFGPIKYKHYYITNNRYTLEFGGGTVGDNVVQIHANRVVDHAFIEATFFIRAEHRERMEKVIGGTNYSLCLRNCEHVARYIFCGSWICLQMMEAGVLHTEFARYLLGPSLKMCNQIPEALRRREEVRPIFPDAEGRIQLIVSNKQGLSAVDNNKFNVVVIGPTGCGKSTLINHLFNRTVCPVGASLMSVTREIVVHEGETDILQVNGVTRRRVNIIDTLGFCDSTLHRDEVVQVVQDWLVNQAVMIDCFVIVVSNRIERDHEDSIKKMMGWLNFANHKGNFVFVYNKADLCPSEETVQTNIALMAQQLGNGSENLVLVAQDGDHVRRVLPLNIACGISPDTRAPQVQQLLQPLCERIFSVRVHCRRAQRVPISPESCSIL